MNNLYGILWFYNEVIVHNCTEHLARVNPESWKDFFNDLSKFLDSYSKQTGK